MTDIEKRRNKLLDCLQNLCRLHYLPFTTKVFNSASEIIDDFLNKCKEFIKSDDILAIVPGFYSLDNFQEWSYTRIDTFDTYQVLSKLSSEYLNKLFNIQTSIELNNDDSFSHTIIQTLNTGSKNGRIKIIIKLHDEKATTIVEPIIVSYHNAEKTIEFSIARKLYQKIVRGIIVPNNANSEFEILTVGKKTNNYKNTLEVDNPINTKLINIAKFINLKRLSFEYELAKKILTKAIEHCFYITEETSLLYYFSNNTEIEDRDVGLGGIFVLVKKSITDDANDIDCNTINNYFSRLTDALASRLIYFYHTQQIKDQATRSAISQVMARNMSHNIGAHVLNNLTDGETLTSKVKCKSYVPLKKLGELGEKDGEIIYQSAIFNNYVKCRMDYLSNITFGTPVMHTNKKAYEKLYKDFDKVRLLLEHISGLSNFKFSIRFAKDGVELSDSRDVLLAIPNDLLGCQALYNIIENVIRNTAKHNQAKPAEDTTIFTVNFSEIELSNNEIVEDWKIYYQVEIYDNISVNGDKEFSDNEKQEKETYYNVKQIDPGTTISNIDWLVYSQNVRINESILDTNYQLRNSALGLLEMEASAAYLRKLDIIRIEHPDFRVNEEDNSIYTNGKLNILKAFSKEVDGKHCLAYRFFVNKPTEYLFVGDFELTNHKARFRAWGGTPSAIQADTKRGKRLC